MPQLGKRVSATFTLEIPSLHSSNARLRRAPKFVDPATQSIAVALTAVNGTASNPALPLTVINMQSPSCVASAGGTVCTTSLPALVGSDTFAVTAYSQPNAGGSALSAGKVTAAISASGPNNVTVSLGGVVFSIALSMPAPPPTGTAVNIPLTVVAMDANGTPILGATPYAAPIVLSDSDTSGVTKLSTTTVGSPTTVVALEYSGGALTAAVTITASATGTPKFSMTFLPAPSYAVASIAVQLAFPTLPLGQQMSLKVSAKNAGGTVITGTYDHPIVLSSTTLQFSPSSLTKSTQAANVVASWIDGFAGPSAGTMTATADGHSATASIAPETGFAFYAVGTDSATDIFGFKMQLGLTRGSRAGRL